MLDMTSSLRLFYAALTSASSAPWWDAVNSNGQLITSLTAPREVQQQYAGHSTDATHSPVAPTRTSASSGTSAPANKTATAAGAVPMVHSPHIHPRSNGDGGRGTCQAGGGGDRSCNLSASGPEVSGCSSRRVDTEEIKERLRLSLCPSTLTCGARSTIDIDEIHAYVEPRNPKRKSHRSTMTTGKPGERVVNDVACLHTAVVALLYASGFGGLLPSSHVYSQATVAYGLSTRSSSYFDGDLGAAGAHSEQKIAVAAQCSGSSQRGSLPVTHAALYRLPYRSAASQEIAKVPRVLFAMLSFIAYALLPPSVTWCLCTCACVAASSHGDSSTSSNSGWLLGHLLYLYMVGLCASFIGTCRIDSTLAQLEERERQSRLSPLVSGRKPDHSKDGDGRKLHMLVSDSSSSNNNAFSETCHVYNSEDDGAIKTSPDEKPQRVIEAASMSVPSPSQSSPTVAQWESVAVTGLRLRVLGFSMGFLALHCTLTATCTAQLVFVYYDYTYGGRTAVTHWLVPSAIAATALGLSLLARCAITSVKTRRRTKPVRCPMEQSCDDGNRESCEWFYVSWLGIWVPQSLHLHYTLLLVSLLSLTTSFLYYAVAFHECLMLAALSLTLDPHATGSVSGGVTPSPYKATALSNARVLLARAPLVEQYPHTLMLYPLTVVRMLLPFPRGGVLDGALALALSNSGGSSPSAAHVSVTFLYSQVALPMAVAHLIYLVATRIVGGALAAMKAMRRRRHKSGEHTL